MNLYRVTEHGLSIQRALRDMLAAVPHTHWVTLNFHADKAPAEAEAALRLWSLDVINRLFRSPAFVDIPTANLFSFVALPEYTRSGHHPHFHLLLYVHPDRRAWFARCAGRLWKRVVPTGTSDVQVIGPSDVDHAKVIAYGTKHAGRPFSYEGFLTSSMLYLPEFGGPLRSRPVAAGKRPAPAPCPVLRAQRLP